MIAIGTEAFAGGVCTGCDLIVAHRGNLENRGLNAATWGPASRTKGGLVSWWQVHGDLMMDTTRSNALKKWLMGCGAVLIAMGVVAAEALPVRGDGQEQLQAEEGRKAEVWRNAWGTDRTFPFRLEEGRSTEESSVDVLSRADWVVEREGRTYLVYETDPENREPNEGVWIGLLGEDGEILRKIVLASDVKDISGVQENAAGEMYIEATDAEGVRQRISLRYPEPWPEIGTEGSEWDRYSERRMQLCRRMWEDWAGAGSGYAAEHVVFTVEEMMEEECGRVVERLRAAEIPDALREDLAAEPERTLSVVKEAVGDSSMWMPSQHWANVEDCEARQEYLAPCLHNWFEGLDHPEEWAKLYGARGEFRGEEFRATNGVVLVQWPVEKNPWNTDTRDKRALIRLAPERVREEDGRMVVGFNLVLPEFMYLDVTEGRGTFVEDADGVLRVAELELKVRGGGDEDGEAQEGYEEEGEGKVEREEEQKEERE